MSGDKHSRRVGRRPGRRSSKMDMRAKLERSRQSARECRARKKLRYQYLEDLVANREKAVFALRDELELVSILIYIYSIMAIMSRALDVMINIKRGWIHFHGRQFHQHCFASLLKRTNVKEKNLLPLGTNSFRL